MSNGVAGRFSFDMLRQTIGIKPMPTAYDALMSSEDILRVLKNQQLHSLKAVAAKQPGLECWAIVPRSVGTMLGLLAFCLGVPFSMPRSQGGC